MVSGENLEKLGICKLKFSGHPGIHSLYPKKRFFYHTNFRADDTKTVTRIEHILIDLVSYAKLRLSFQKYSINFFSRKVVLSRILEITEKKYLVELVESRFEFISWSILMKDDKGFILMIQQNI